MDPQNQIDNNSLLQNSNKLEVIADLVRQYGDNVLSYWKNSAREELLKHPKLSSKFWKDWVKIVDTIVNSMSEDNLTIDRNLINKLSKEVWPYLAQNNWYLPNYNGQDTFNPNIQKLNIQSWPKAPQKYWWNNEHNISQESQNQIAQMEQDNEIQNQTTKKLEKEEEDKKDQEAKQEQENKNKRPGFTKQFCWVFWTIMFGWWIYSSVGTDNLTTDNRIPQAVYQGDKDIAPEVHQ